MEDYSDEIYAELTRLRNADPSGEEIIDILAELDDYELESLAAYLSTRIADLSLLPTTDAIVFAELEAEDIEESVLGEIAFRRADSAYGEPYPVALGILSDGTHVPVPLY